MILMEKTKYSYWNHEMHHLWMSQKIFSRLFENYLDKIEYYQEKLKIIQRNFLG